MSGWPVFYDYEAFAPVLQKNPVIWDTQHICYKMKGPTKKAFLNIEKELNLESKFSVLHVDQDSL